MSIVEVNFNVPDIRWNANHQSICKDSILMLYDSSIEYRNSLQGCIFSVLLSNNEVLMDLNQKMRGKLGATDVISIRYDNYIDIAISYDVCHVFAMNNMISFDDRLCHLIVHSTLHCMGYDHDSTAGYNEMRNIEANLIGSSKVVYS